MLEIWEREQTFDRLRERNRGGPKFRFMDGPITANNPAGVHHGHGRTLKDVFQRYKAMRGFDQRYQNGFDSQGLWVEVEVEKELGPRVEARDRGVRARRVRAPLPRPRRSLQRGHDEPVHPPRPVDGLGQRLLHLQRHEHRVHLDVPEGDPRPRLAVQGPPLDAVVSALRHLALASTSRRARRTTSRWSTRRSSCASRSPVVTTRRSSSGRRRRGRCRRTSPQPSSPTPSTA